MTVAATAASIYAQNANSAAQAKAIGKNNQIQADQITKANAQQMNENQQRAYAERGAMREAGAESGINLGSNSFLSAMQTSAIQQSNENGLIIANNANQQTARQASADSDVAKLPFTNGIGASLQIAGTAASAFSSAAKARPPALSTSSSASAPSVTPK